MEAPDHPGSYLAQQVVSVSSPHLHVGGDGDSERLQRPQGAGVRRHLEGCALPIGQQAAHQVWPRNTEDRVTESQAAKSHPQVIIKDQSTRLEVVVIS